MIKSHAFTLTDLFVVAVILTVVPAAVVPSLRSAREPARRAVYLANTRGLGISWALYAEDNDDRIASAKTARIERVGTSEAFGMVLGGYHSEPTWSCWVPGQLWDDREAHKAAIMLGTLYPYNECLDMYRCPTEDRDQRRNYSIVDSMNGYEDHGGRHTRGFRKLSEIESPGARLVFMEEGVVSSESWSIWPDRIQWWDSVSVQHGEGAVVGLADNSAQCWRWADRKTILFAIGAMDAVQSAKDNRDFDRIQEAVWTLKHRP